MLAHRHPGEFERSSMLHGDRPSCARVVQLADVTLVPLNRDEQARRFPGKYAVAHLRLALGHILLIM